MSLGRDSLGAGGVDRPVTPSGELTLEHFYDAYPRIEEQFKALLDISLNPRGPEFLYELVHGLGLRSSATVLDLGCGEGRHTVALAARFGFTVIGIDPVNRHLALAKKALAVAAKKTPRLSEAVRFQHGTAEQIPLSEGTVDLIWCRDVFSHVAAHEEAFAECRRVLRGTGRMLLYQMFATGRLQPGEAEALFVPLRVVSADPETTEAAIRAAGLRIDDCIVLGSEGGEYAEEQNAAGARSLIHAARLLREPQRYVAEFGKVNYDIKLADCLWHIYRMIGKLSTRTYLLSAGQ
jgi:SAM-dependent methyltransferase